MQNTIFQRRAKFNEFEKKINDDVDTINKILSNSILYLAIIGKTAKFATFHEFIDFCIIFLKKRLVLILSHLKRK